MKKRRYTTINETKIKYLTAADRIYKVKDINFSNLTIEASETDLLASDVPAEELFDVMEFKDFRVRLRNWKGNLVDFEKYARKRKKVS